MQIIFITACRSRPFTLSHTHKHFVHSALCAICIHSSQEKREPKRLTLQLLSYVCYTYRGCTSAHVQCTLYLRVAIIPVNVIVIIADGGISIEMNISFLWLHRECPPRAPTIKLIVETKRVCNGRVKRCGNPHDGHESRCRHRLPSAMQMWPTEATEKRTAAGLREACHRGWEPSVCAEAPRKTFSDAQSSQRVRFQAFRLMLDHYFG